ncbi:hypothetical protein KAH37_09635 [bacterium]|nr:hypothetical protein [bacterium]
MIRVLVMLMLLMLPCSIFASMRTAVLPLIVSMDEEDGEEDGNEEDEDEEGDSSDNSDEFGDEKKSDEFGNEKKLDEFGDEKKSDEFGDEKKADEFGDEKKSDEFGGEPKSDEGSGDDFSSSPPPADDDFVMEKRSDEVLSFKKPDVVKLSRPSFMYVEPSLTSKKMFELYKNDEMEVFEKNGDFYRARFLGKDGWVLAKDVLINKWHSYRLFLDLTGGIAWGGKDFENFSVIGNYNLAFHVSILDFLSVGAVFKSFSLDTDALYIGGGLQVRYLVHGLRTKNSRFALTFGGGYISTTDKPSSDSINIVMQGYYIEGAIDYIYRVWEWIHLGVGGDITYDKVWGTIATGEGINRDGLQGGVHLKVIINLYR